VNRNRTFGCFLAEKDEQTLSRNRSERIDFMSAKVLARALIKGETESIMHGSYIF
jgi:hypothetical protein